MPTSPSNLSPVQRQISLPLSKAIEISWKNIRLRLSRSLLVTSGIILALAFLISIQTNEAMITAMRGWIASVGESRKFDKLRSKQRTLTEEVRPAEVELQKAVRAAPAPSKEAVKFDSRKVLGKDLPEIQLELGSLPVNVDELINALTSDPGILPKLQNWLSGVRELKQVRDQITAPQWLEAEMKKNGVPTSPAEIQSNRTQTRWLLGLALLVAFVGILNAMVMSVTERFREIGTMKCLGALDGFIIKLFLIESLFQGVVGTTLGLLLGFLMSLLNVWSSYGSYAWKNMAWSVHGQNLAFSFCVGVVLTVAGALYPAWQAARMQPIEAMRVET